MNEQQRRLIAIGVPTDVDVVNGMTTPRPFLVAIWKPRQLIFSPVVEVFQ
jgi:hypothetical protein